MWGLHFLMGDIYWQVCLQIRKIIVTLHRICGNGVLVRLTANLSKAQSLECRYGSVGRATHS